MLFRHPERAHRLRLGYCLNVHPADDLEGLHRGLESVTLPLRDALAPDGSFGVGLYLSAPVARELLRSDRELERLARILSGNDLDPFTYNAFPAERFHEPGLKRDVFRPTWAEPARAEFTRDVADLAVQLAGSTPRGHLSISTHTGGHEAHAGGTEFDGAVRDALLASAEHLAGLASRTGQAIVLALEPEPRSHHGDTAEFARATERWDLARQPAAAHLGLCLDTCHAAVEFESREHLAALPARTARPLGKIQYTNALRLESPAADEAGRRALLALDEPIYLHQLTAREPGGQLLRLADLSEMESTAERERLLAAEEWRCHFHVPVDLERSALSGGLATTSSVVDPILTDLLGPVGDAWMANAPATPAGAVPELHLELETYTWSVLPGAAARTPADLVRGLSAEYRATLAHLESAGWQSAS